MRGLALALAAGALITAGCGSSNDQPSAVPDSTAASASKTSTQTAAVAAAPANAAASTACSSESRKKAHGKSPFAQCVSALKKLGSGKATSPAAACKGLSKKRPKVKGKHKGKRAKSPYALCVAAAAKLRGKGSSGNGSAA